MKGILLHGAAQLFLSLIASNCLWCLQKFTIPTMQLNCFTIQPQMTALDSLQKYSNPWCNTSVFQCNCNELNNVSWLKHWLKQTCIPYLMPSATATNFFGVFAKVQSFTMQLSCFSATATNYDVFAKHAIPKCSLTFSHCDCDQLPLLPCKNTLP